MKFDDHIFVSAGFSNKVYHLAEPKTWHGEDSHTLCGIRRDIACYPLTRTRLRMAELYRYLRPCHRCSYIQRIRDASQKGRKPC